MSWKLTKKLKETHLAPSFASSRSSSTSTITPQSLNTAPSGQPTSSLATEATLPYQAQQSSTTSSIKPGLLKVTIFEAKGLQIPGGSHASHNNSSLQGRPPSSSSPTRQAGTLGHRSQVSMSSAAMGRMRQRYLPYCIIEFDKNQVIVDPILIVGSTVETPMYRHTAQFDVSRDTDISCQFYLRNPGAIEPGKDDIFLGSCRVQPRFEEPKQPSPISEKDKKKEKDKERLAAAAAASANNAVQGLSGIQWVELTGGSGMLRIGVEFKSNQNVPLTIDAFDLLKVVGKGSFGKVMQVRKKDTSRIYALKTIRKAHIISRSEVNHTLAERTVLAQINNPFIVPLKFSFQSPEKLYLVLAFVNGGELFHHLQREGRFEVNRARFYTAELLIALECLHDYNVIYRDLKPENILLDFSGHIALCDFGLCKLNMKQEDKTNTFCGTPEYLAPELLHGQGYTKTVDWWTLGVLLYEMLTGLPPFYDENVNEMYRKILQEPLVFPSLDIVDRDAKSLLTRLLDRDPVRRLGANGAAEIKAHRFFDSIDWKKLVAKKIQPTFKPSVENAMDTVNFDPEFTNEAPTDSYVEGDMLSQSVQQQFTGWSYNGGGMGTLREGNMSVRDGFPPGSIHG